MNTYHTVRLRKVSTLAELGDGLLDVVPVVKHQPTGLDVAPTR